MPKASLHPVLKQIENSLIEAMREGLKSWRPDLYGPESISDYESLARGVMEKFFLTPGNYYLTYDNETEEYYSESHPLSMDRFRAWRAERQPYPLE